MSERPEIESYTNDDFKLGLTAEFKRLQEKYPEMVKDVLEVIEDNRLSVMYQPVRLHEISVELFSRLNSYAYKVTLPGQEKLFVKIDAYSDPNRARGYEELTASGEAARLLKDLPNVRVIRYILGYEDSKRSFFVSRWENLTPLKTYMRDVRYKEGGFAKWAKLDKQYMDIQARLVTFFDVHKSNMFYDEDTDEIVLFDLGRIKGGEGQLNPNIFP